MKRIYFSFFVCILFAWACSSTQTVVETTDNTSESNTSEETDQTTSQPSNTSKSVHTLTPLSEIKNEATMKKVQPVK